MLAPRGTHLMTREIQKQKSHSQAGRGSVLAQAPSMWWGSEAFRTNTNSEPPRVTSLSSRITRDAEKSGVNLDEGIQRSTEQKQN